MDYDCKFEFGLSEALDESFREIRSDISEAKKKINEKAMAKYPVYSDEQIANALARTIYGEGRGDGGAEGMKRSLDSILARAGNDKGKIVGVVSEPKAYSCWNKTKPDFWNPAKYKIQPHTQAAESPELWKQAQELANQVLSGEYKPSHQYTHYVTNDLYQATKNVKGKWYKGHNGVLDGEHRFFTNKEINGTNDYNIPGRYTTQQVTGQKRTTAQKPSVSIKTKAAEPRAVIQRPKQYTVVNGDTMTDIAKNNGMSLKQLQKLNTEITDPNKISLGQKINLR